MSSLYARDEASVAGIEKLRFFPLEVVSGRGSTLVAPDGRELLDLSATWTASGLGHGHPAVAPRREQALLEPGAFDALQPLGGNDLIGVDVAALQRHTAP